MSRKTGEKTVKEIERVKQKKKKRKSWHLSDKEVILNIYSKFPIQL